MIEPAYQSYDDIKTDSRLPLCFRPPGWPPRPVRPDEGRLRALGSQPALRHARNAGHAPTRHVRLAPFLLLPNGAVLPAPCPLSGHAHPGTPASHDDGSRGPLGRSGHGPSRNGHGPKPAPAHGGDGRPHTGHPRRIVRG